MATTGTKKFQNYVGGEWVDAAGGETFESLVPATGDAIGEFPRSTPEDVDRAVAAAKEAYEGWRLTPAPKRAEVLYRFANLLVEHKDDLADLMSREMGKVVVEAADLFNASQYRRTVGGIAKSLGQPRASIVQLSGVKSELVVTIVWDISWYQYRVSLDSAQPVRLAERGQDPRELESSFGHWNAHLEDDGRLVPDIARL